MNNSMFNPFGYPVDLSKLQMPVQNFINTNSKVDLEARYLNENEDIANIIVSNRTLFIDEKNTLICIKEVDGTISKRYEIIIPKDEKDIEIDKLKNQINVMEEKYNELSKLIKSNNDVEQSDAINGVNVKPNAKTTTK